VRLFNIAPSTFLIVIDFWGVLNTVRCTAPPSLCLSASIACKGEAIKVKTLNKPLCFFWKKMLPKIRLIHQSTA
ncbi:MAG: hypothetical protein ACRC5E_15185, partial [Shewanella sp.]